MLKKVGITGVMSQGEYAARIYSLEMRSRMTTAAMIIAVCRREFIPAFP
jgi:hypothetical protein